MQTSSSHTAPPSSHEAIVISDEEETDLLEEVIEQPDDNAPELEDATEDEDTEGMVGIEDGNHEATPPPLPVKRRRVRLRSLFIYDISDTYLLCRDLSRDLRHPSLPPRSPSARGNNALESLPLPPLLLSWRDRPRLLFPRLFHRLCRCRRLEPKPPHLPVPNLVTMFSVVFLARRCSGMIQRVLRLPCQPSDLCPRCVLHSLLESITRTNSLLGS
jgi:hypothetical protein